MEKKLLLVDDEENIVRSLTRLLRRDGYKIFTANSGKEGLEVLKENKVGVIISDQRMPEMNGTEFLNQVKGVYPETIRIVLSGYTDLITITEAINTGSIYKFLTKPWEDDLIRKNIKEAFSQYELKVENIRLQEELARANQELIEANKHLGDDMKVKERTADINMKSLQIAQEVLENLPMGIVCIGEDGFIVMANFNAHDILLSGEGALVGMSIEKVFPDEILNKINDEGQDQHVLNVEFENKGTVNVLISEMGKISGSEGKIVMLNAEAKNEAA